jgi:hypothetical protein
MILDVPVKNCNLKSGTMPLEITTKTCDICSPSHPCHNKNFHNGIARELYMMEGGGESFCRKNRLFKGGTMKRF